MDGREAVGDARPDWMTWEKDTYFAKAVSWMPPDRQVATWATFSKLGINPDNSNLESVLIAVLLEAERLVFEIGPEIRTAASDAAAKMMEALERHSASVTGTFEKEAREFLESMAAIARDAAIDEREQLRSETLGLVSDVMSDAKAEMKEIFGSMIAKQNMHLRKTVDEMGEMANRVRRGYVVMPNWLAALVVLVVAAASFGSAVAWTSRPQSAQQAIQQPAYPAPTPPIPNGQAIAQ